MYKDGQSMKLENLRDMGINPNAILDIGAHTGEFHSLAKRVWPDVGIASCRDCERPHGGVHGCFCNPDMKQS